MANDAHEEFFGCTLTKDKKEYIWDPSADSEEDVEHKLQINSACLGFKAKDGDRNLLEVTTEDDDGKKITCPIVSLRVGGKECIHLDLGFYNTTKFTLKEGFGPLSLCGVHLRALPLDFDENGESSSEDEEVPDLIPAKPIKKETKKSEPVKAAVIKVDQKKEGKTASPVKRPLPADKTNERSAKKAKIVELVESEDEEEEDGTDDEESEDEETPSLLDAEAEEVSDEDSEEGDDEPEGDDVDSDEDDEEMESEESGDEEEEVKKPSKVNGHAPKSTPGKGGPQKKTPAADVKTPKKTPGKKDAPTTPKSQAKKTPEELKAFLLKSPNLPKKFDKFANFMKNNMKVTDEKSQKEFWDYVQKNKK